MDLVLLYHPSPDRFLLLIAQEVEGQVITKRVTLQLLVLGVTKLALTMISDNFFSLLYESITNFLMPKKAAFELGRKHNPE